MEQCVPIRGCSWSTGKPQNGACTIRCARHTSRADHYSYGEKGNERLFNVTALVKERESLGTFRALSVKRRRSKVRKLAMSHATTSWPYGRSLRRLRDYRTTSAWDYFSPMDRFQIVRRGDMMSKTTDRCVVGSGASAANFAPVLYIGSDLGF